MAGFLKKGWKDGDCHKTVILAAGGGRGEMRGGM